MQKKYFFVIKDSRITTKLKHEVQSNLQVFFDDVMYRPAINVCFACYLSDGTMAVWAVVLTVYRLDVFSFMHWSWSTTTGKAFNTTKFVHFYSSWFKPPRDHFLFENSLRNSRTVYCFFLGVLSLNVYHQRKTALCLSLSTTTTQCHKYYIITK